MRKVWKLIFALIIGYLLYAFIYSNKEAYAIKFSLAFVKWESAEIPMAGIILGCVLIGAIIVGLVGLWSQVRLRSTNRAQRQDIKRLEEELAELRSLPFKEVEQAEGVEEDIPEGKERPQEFTE